MTTTLQGVIINGVEYITYADVFYADEYLAADPNAAAWRAEADDDVKARALVNATRVLNNLRWRGSKTDADQELAWPRTGVSDRDGSVASDTIPQRIIDACVELANQVLNGVDIANFRTTATAERRIKAGSVEIENFRGAEGSPVPLPWPAWSLIRDYISGPASSAGSISAGTDCETTTKPGYRPAWPI